MPRLLAKLICFAIPIFFILLGYFSFDYVIMRQKVMELSRLREETQLQRSQVHFFCEKIGELERKIAGMREFDRRLRILANLEASEGSTRRFFGIGGPSPEDIRETLLLQRNEEELMKQMRHDLERLDEEATAEGSSLKELESLLQNKRVQLTHTPSIWPARGWFTSGFGYRISPFTGLRQMHEGIDISNRTGTPIFAPADGLVTNIGREWGFGKILVISHGFGFSTRYGHLHKINVKIGQKVKRGQKIAEVGSSGKSTGPHLHYEVRENGVPVNPMKYILN
ncbi:MAG: M23 family metallopeptidase [Syntrophobacterales bacterium]|nr:MAG: M23 family metallopeptidase [Syntrophobacterales bacterium]